MPREPLRAGGQQRRGQGRRCACGAKGVPYLVVVEGALDLSRGRLVGQTGSELQPLRYPYAEARTLYEWGLMCAGSPGTDQGLKRLEAAAEIFRRLGSRPYVGLAQKAMVGPA